MTTEALAQGVLLYLFTKLSEPISVTIDTDGPQSELTESDGEVDVNKQEILNFYKYINTQVKLDRQKLEREIAARLSENSSHRGVPLPLENDIDVESSHSFITADGETVRGKVVFKQTESGLRTAIYTSFLDQKIFSTSQSFRRKREHVNVPEVIEYSDDEDEDGFS